MGLGDGDDHLEDPRAQIIPLDRFERRKEIESFLDEEVIVLDIGSRGKNQACVRDRHTKRTYFDGTVQHDKEMGIGRLYQRGTMATSPEANLLRLSDLLRLCASTMRLLAHPHRTDGATNEVSELAIALDRIAGDARRIAAGKLGEIERART